MIPTTDLLMHKIRTGNALPGRHQQELRAGTASLEHGQADVERSMGSVRRGDSGEIFWLYTAALHRV